MAKKILKLIEKFYYKIILRKRYDNFIYNYF